MIKLAKNSHMDYMILFLGRTAFTELSLGMMPLAYIKDDVKNSSAKPFTLFTGMILLHSPAIHHMASSLVLQCFKKCLENVY